MFDSFLKIDGIPGESTDAKHKDWIEVLSYHFSADQRFTSSKSSTGGASSERVDLGPFVIVKGLDKASPKLYEHCCNGKHIKEITMEVCRAGGDKVKYFEVKLEESIVASVKPGGSSKGAESVPLEEVAFDYGKIKWTYTQQKRADGSGGGNVSGGWDATANKTYA